MPSLFIAGEQVESSPPIVAYKIMSLIKTKSDEKISIFDITDGFKKEKWFSYNNILLGLVFLYTVGLIDFNEPYVVKRCEN